MIMKKTVLLATVGDERSVTPIIFSVKQLSPKKVYLITSTSTSQHGVAITEEITKLDDTIDVVIAEAIPDDIVFKNHNVWKNPCAEAKNWACERAKELGCDLILMTDADVLLDVECVEKAKSLLDSSNQIVVLPYSQYSLFSSFMSKVSNQIQNLFASLNRRLKIQPIRFGVYIGKADVISLEDCLSEYDRLQQKVKTTWIPTKNLHLRPRIDIKSQIAHGIARANLHQYSWLKVIIFSVFTFQPFTLIGYWKGKMKK